MNEGAHVCAAMCSSVSTSALRCMHADTNAVAVSTAARVSEATDALEQVRTCQSWSLQNVVECERALCLCTIPNAPVCTQSTVRATAAETQTSP
jgi:hypothetical protein